MNPDRCGCNTGDEGTSFCAKHREAFALMLASDNNTSPFEELARLEHEGLPCTMISYCNGHHFSDKVADAEETFQEKMNKPKKVITVWVGSNYESDGQPSEQKEWEDLEGSGQEQAFREGSDIDGRSDRELDAEYEREKGFDGWGSQW